MEEIGWGQDALHFPHLVIDGLAIDSFHDLLRVLKRMRTGELTLLFKALGGLMLVAFLGLCATRAGRALCRRANPSVIVLLVLGVGCLFTATVLDVHVTDAVWFLRRRPPYELEEVFEGLGELMLSLIVLEGWLNYRAAARRSSA
ncbi:MAG: hypothetical protein IT305_23470 [Chloroflexi bacterium]|nr:hypothetical protein [Chloroflexota bacterium]